MDYTTLGRSGLRVSRLCLGTLNFGFKTSASDSHTIMDRAHHHGTNFFDTSDVYGFQEGSDGMRIDNGVHVWRIAERPILTR